MTQLRINRQTKLWDIPLYYTLVFLVYIFFTDCARSRQIRESAVNRYKDLIFRYIVLLGAFCATIYFIPQAIKIYTSKNTNDISLANVDSTDLWHLLLASSLTYQSHKAVPIALLAPNIITL